MDENNVWAPLAEGLPPKIYVPGQLIYLQDTYPAAFYYLESGSARSFISSPEGTERLLTLHHSGDLMGEASFFDGAASFGTCGRYYLSSRRPASGGSAAWPSQGGWRRSSYPRRAWLRGRGQPGDSQPGAGTFFSKWLDQDWLWGRHGHG